jgi:tRNA(Ile)-lysidine synthase
MMSVSNCLVCGKKLTGRQRSFCSLQCKNDYFLSYDALKKRANERKQELVDQLGGSCSRCGYDRSLDALSFYNRDGESLHIDINMLANNNPDKLRLKLSGAQVLCRNCYEEYQNPENQITMAPVPHNDKRLSEKEFSTNLSKFYIGNKKVVAAVSGGIDSVVMLDLLAKALPKAQIIVAHLNHGYRAEADDDERFVRELAKYYGLEYETEKIVPPESGNIEEYFRDNRREFLKSVADKVGADFIALAHNANDQAETVIMNLVRGSGPTGLGGMLEQDGKIIRPLFNFARTDIEAYAKENNIVWQEDVTNKDTRFSRNYVRLEILPKLARLNQAYLENIARSAEIQQKISKDNDNLSLSSRPVWRDLSTSSSVGEVARDDREAKREIKNLTKKHFDAIEKQLSESAGTKEIHLPGNLRAVRRYDKLEIISEMRDNMNPAPTGLNLGHNRFANFRISVFAQSARSESLFEMLVSEKQLSRLTVRSPIAGDRIDKFGLAGQKKLQDLFVDAKIDRYRRRTWPVFVDEKDEIMWVPGLAIAKGLVPQTGNRLIRLKEEK